MKKALLIIDVQNDFCPGGAMAVPDGDKIISIINNISQKFYKVVATQDWHPITHISFAKNHHKKIFDTITIGDINQVLWPDHCVQGTKGAELHHSLNLNNVDLILRKGNNPLIDSYSAFLENDKVNQTGLHYYLKGMNITDLYICGLATDYCVYNSAVDAINFGFYSHVVLDATKGIDFPAGNLEKCINDMKKKRIEVISHEQL